MFVETSMGESCSPHQIHQTYAVKPSLAKQHRGRLDDVLAICLRLRFGHSHLQYLDSAQKSCAHST
jgi:hypothetical protein